MTDDDKALVERLRALHVWPQSIADGHAELLTPRQIDKLYEVGAVSHEATDRIEALSAENERLRGELQAIIEYSQKHVDDTDAYVMSKRNTQAAQNALGGK